MSDYVYFQMSEPFRRSLIARHVFYVEQARKRLLSQFANIEAEAQAALEQWVEQNRGRFDPDRHDAGTFFESALSEGAAFSQLLTDMRNNTRLSVVAGMFHEWEKQLKNWLAKEVQHWHHDEELQLPLRIWQADFAAIMGLLSALGWGTNNAPYFGTLDACRHVVNVYKHGDGGSFSELKKHFQEYLNWGFPVVHEEQLDPDMLNHTHLVVSDDQLEKFSAGIIQFWEDVPVDTCESGLTCISTMRKPPKVKKQNSK